MSVIEFQRKVPRFMFLLMQDFPTFGILDAAAVFGNGGHESAGLQPINEKNPTVAGSRGGWGWFQWTGARRVAFENYCKRNGLDPASDMAQYKWLFLELKGPEKRAILKTAQASTLEQKVVAFENAFERSGVKHYDSRIIWAQRALEAYEDSEYFGTENKVPSMTTLPGGALPQVPLPSPRPEPAPTPTGPENGGNDDIGGPVSKANGGAAGAAAGTAGGATVAGSLVILMSYQGWLPTEPTAAAAATFLITTVVTALPGVIGGWIGAYRAKKNSV